MSSKGWIGVDLDGTLAEYHGWKDAAHIGPPILPMLGRVQAWLSSGKDVRIFTARANPRNPDVDAACNAIGDWCLRHLGKELPITWEKDYGMIELWDDRCVQVVPNTGRIATEEAAESALREAEAVADEQSYIGKDKL